MIAKSEVLEPVDVARSLAESGVSVVPLQVDGSKLPKGKWKEWQRRIIKTHEVSAVFRGRVGIATVCGEVSGNLECLDIDNPALVEPFEALVAMTEPGLLAKLPIVATPRDNWGGRHYRYRLSYAPGGNEKLAESAPQPEFDKQGNPVIDQRTGRQKIAPKTWIETRGEGGYAIAPGSPPETHESGLPYKHIAGPPLTDIPVITAEQHAILWHAARSFNRNIPEQPQGNLAGVYEGPGISPGDDFDAKVSIAELIEPVGWVKVHSGRGITHWRRPGKEGRGWSATTGCTSKDGKPLFCVFSSNAYPFEGAANGRPCSSYSSFAVYTLLHHRGDFRAAAKALYANGYGTRVDRTTDQGQQQAAPPQQPQFVIRKPLTALELMEEFPELDPPLIDGLVRRSELANIVAETKLGKSWLMFYTAITCIGGGKLFGRFRTTPGRCLYIDNELRKPTIAYRIRCVGDAMGLSRTSYGGNLFIESLRGQRADIFTLEKYLAQFQPGDLDYIVFDALYRFWPRGLSENANEHWVEVMNAVESYAERLQAAILIVHHSTKGLQGEKRVTDVGAGGGAQSRAADAHIVLRQHEQPEVAVVDAALRSFKKIEPFCLRWDWPLWLPADDCDPTKLKTNRPTGRGKAIEPVSDKPSRFEKSCSDATSVLLRLGPASKTRWREEAGINSSRMNAIVEALLERKQIEPCEVKTGGGTYDGFRVIQPSDGSDTSDSPS